MTSYVFVQVDAFTDRPLSGNPCAVVFDADDLSDDVMQAVAREMNLSETSFVLQSERADIRARYFTPANEIPMAGHPTIATIHALIERGVIAPHGVQHRVTLELQAGVLDVNIESANDAPPRIVMTQLKPQFLSEHDPEATASLFGLSASDVLPDVPVQTVSTGTPQLMLPVKDIECLRKSRIDADAYRAYKAGSDFFSAHLFCLGGVTEMGATFARHFVAPPDLIEDPFTGSATGGMAAYLWHYGLIDAPTFVAEQGHWMHRPGHAYVEVVGPRDDIEAVKVGGQAAIVLRGELLLP